MSALYKYIRFLAYTIEILVFFVVGRIPNLIPEINHAKPMILVLVVIMIALFEGRTIGIIFGFMAGLFLDAGAMGSIGFYAAALTCIGFLVGTMAQKIIKFNLITSVAVAIAFTAAFYFAHFIFEFLFCGYSDAIYTLLNHYLVGMLYTVMLSPFVYFFNKAFAVSIIKATE